MKRFDWESSGNVLASCTTRADRSCRAGVQHAAPLRAKQNGAGYVPAPFGRYSDLRTLNGLCCAGVGSCWLGERATAGFFLGALVDLDGAFEVSAVFDHDARGGQIADHRAIFLDFNAVLGAKISLHVAVDHYFAGNDVSSHRGGGANGQLPLGELDQSC